MNTSPNGIKFIEQNEGFRSTVYGDVGGKRTIGYGHLILPWETFTTLTQEQAEALLIKDLGHVEVYLSTRNDLNQHEYDALADFGFNLGTGALHELISHGYDALPTQIVRWDHVDGVVFKGLLLRREKELALWETGLYEN